MIMIMMVALMITMIMTMTRTANIFVWNVNEAAPPIKNSKLMIESRRLKWQLIGRIALYMFQSQLKQRGAQKYIKHCSQKQKLAEPPVLRNVTENLGIFDEGKD